MIYMTFYVMLNRDAFGRIFMRALLILRPNLNNTLNNLLIVKINISLILDNVQQNL